MMVCILRALAEDENRAQRAEHGIDLALLDGITWPDHLWDYLRLVLNPLGRLSAPSPPPAAGAPSREDEDMALNNAASEEQPRHHMHVLGQGIRKYSSEEAAPKDAKGLLPKRSFARRRCTEFYSLPPKDKVRVQACQHIAASPSSFLPCSRLSLACARPWKVYS